MKRIVRLTESDLTRIVRRIIMEKPEGTALGEEDVMRIPFGGSATEVEVYGVTGNVKKYYTTMFSAKTTKETKPNDRGVATPTGNVKIEFRLKLGDKIKYNNRVEVTVACSTKKVVGTFTVMNAPELAGNTFTIKQGSTVVTGRSGMSPEVFAKVFKLMPAPTYSGVVKEIADTACAS
jgi:hypothetical protein